MDKSLEKVQELILLTRQASLKKWGNGFDDFNRPTDWIAYILQCATDHPDEESAIGRKFLMSDRGPDLPFAQSLAGVAALYLSYLDALDRKEKPRRPDADPLAPNERLLTHALETMDRFWKANDEARPEAPTDRKFPNADWDMNGEICRLAFDALQLSHDLFSHDPVFWDLKEQKGMVSDSLRRTAQILLKMEDLEPGILDPALTKARERLASIEPNPAVAKFFEEKSLG